MIMAVEWIPSTLLFVAPANEGERLGQLLPAHHVITIPDLTQLKSHWRTHTPAALIAPMSRKTVKLFTAIRQQNGSAERPLLILIAETPPDTLDTPSADFVIPVAWLSSTLTSALKQREDNRELRQQLEVAKRTKTYEIEHKQSSEEIQLLKSAIVRAVSHELKTPMLQVKAAVAMLLDEGEQDRTTLVGYAMGATARLENVIKNVTQLTESLDIKLQPAQVSEAVAQAIRSLRRSWDHKDHVERIQIAVPDSLPLILADKQALGVVLQLLLDNALKFSKQNVTVSAKATGQGVSISVHDKGVGIAPNEVETIFEPFYQIDHTEARRFGGIGVSLTIVRLILERHYTTIQVESTLGKGSVFSFILPYGE